MWMIVFNYVEQVSLSSVGSIKYFSSDGALKNDTWKLPNIFNGHNYPLKKFSELLSSCMLNMKRLLPGHQGALGF